jgi:hypothetical protein
MRIRKLPDAEARQLFPNQLPLLVQESRPAPHECAPSLNGRHLPIDLSGLRYRPTPPFCAWCGAALQAERSSKAS